MFEFRHEMKNRAMLARFGFGLRAELPAGFTPELKAKFAAIAGNTNNRVVENVFLYALCSALLCDFMYSADSNDDICREHLTVLKMQYPWFKPLSFVISDHQVLPTGPLFAVVEFESFRIIAIRGSATLEDWLFVNFDALVSTVDSFTSLHSGFVRSSQSIPFRFFSEYCDAPIIDSNGNDLRPNPKPVIFTGHSMGGAVAEICALPRLLDDHIYAITFGAPSIVKVTNPGLLNYLWPNHE
jgi:hypothetical protein